MSAVAAVLTALAGAGIGAAFGWLIARTRAATEAARLQADLAAAQVSLEKERQSATEKLQLLQTAREELRLQFETLGQRIFDDKSQKFTELNRKGLEALLNP